MGRDHGLDFTNYGGRQDVESWRPVRHAFEIPPPWWQGVEALRRSEDAKARLAATMADIALIVTFAKARQTRKAAPAGALAAVERATADPEVSRLLARARSGRPSKGALAGAMLRKSHPAVGVKARADGVVEAIVAVTQNVDLGNDIIVAGAFRQFLASVKAGDLPMPPVIWQHDPSRPENILGNILEMEELLPGDSRLPAKLLAAGYGGLYMKVQYDFATPNGEVVYNHVKSGRIVQWSFAYDAPDRSFDEKGHRLLKTITPVYEVSNVLVGMNPDTSILSVKARRFSKSDEAPAWMLAGIQMALTQVARQERTARPVGQGPVAKAVLNYLASGRQ